MTKVTWDNMGDRVYETGIDRGVLYLPDGSGVPWNGLTGVNEDRSDASTTPYYLDGIKYVDEGQGSDYKATLTALTYPDEFFPFDGYGTDEHGLYFDGQVPQKFGLSYRTMLGDPIKGLDRGYKIHILYNLSAVPTNKAYATIDDKGSALDFSWSITGRPELSLLDIGFRPTAHIIADTTKMNVDNIAYLEYVLYGADDAAPSLPDLPTLFAENLIDPLLEPLFETPPLLADPIMATI